MFILDDVVLRAFGISLIPFDMIWILEKIRDHAYYEMYNVEEIRRKIKELRFLYEFGDISKEKYEKKTKALKEKLRLAREARKSLESPEENIMFLKW